MQGDERFFRYEARQAVEEALNGNYQPQVSMDKYLLHGPGRSITINDDTHACEGTHIGSRDEIKGIKIVRIKPGFPISGDLYTTKAHGQKPMPTTRIYYEVL